MNGHRKRFDSAIRDDRAYDAPPQDAQPQDAQLQDAPLQCAQLQDERGDVPGWVLITLMTAGLVIIIWGLAGPALSAVFEQAIQRVTGF